MGAFDHLEWTYDGAFEQLFGLARGKFEQKFSKNSNARGVARGGMLKLRFDWYLRKSEGYTLDSGMTPTRSEKKKTLKACQPLNSSAELWYRIKRSL